MSKCYVISEYIETKNDICEEYIFKELAKAQKDIYSHFVQRKFVIPIRDRKFTEKEKLNKFMSLIYKLYHMEKQYDSYFILEDDCFIPENQLDNLESFFDKTHNDYPCLWGTIQDNRNMIQFPFIRDSHCIIGSSFIINKKALDILYAFVLEYKLENSAWIQEDFDPFLNSFIQKYKIKHFSMNNFIKSCKEPRCPVYNPFDNVFLYHPINKYFIEMLKIIENEECNTLSKEHIFLNDINFDTVSDFRKCGKNGNLFDKKTKLKIDCNSVNLKKSIGFHASSCLSVNVENEEPYLFTTVPMMNITSIRKVIFYFFIQNRQFEYIAKRKISDGVSFVVEPGTNKIVIQAVPYETIDNYSSHSFLLNPVFTKLNQKQYNEAIYKESSPLYL